MISDGLRLAATGLIDSERRAADAARRIVGAAAGTADQTGAADTQPNDSTLIQDIVDLRSSANAFAANAAVFRRLDETEETLGRLIDRET